MTKKQAEAYVQTMLLKGVFGKTKPSDILTGLLDQWPERFLVMADDPEQYAQLAWHDDQLW